MNPAWSFLLALFISYHASANLIDEEPDNFLTPQVAENEVQEQRKMFKNWVKMSIAPPAKVFQPFGSSIELDCEVAGSPVPTIQWIRGNSPLTNDINMNIISESNPTASGRIRSRLIVTQSSTMDRSFTCVGRSGSEMAYASSTVIGASRQALMAQNISDLIVNSNIGSNSKQTRIVYNYKTLMALIGTNVILPCKAEGSPRPEVYWMDSYDNVVGNQNPRIKALPSGELVISGLRWEDNGLYTCVAYNSYNKDTAATYIYPLLNKY